MKEKNTAKRLFSVLWIYLLYAVLTAILVPLPQKEASGELWRQYDARLDTPAAQERVMTIEDSDSALLLRLQLIESARRELIFSTFDLRADESGQDVMAARCAAAERGVQVRMIVDGLNGFLHLQGDATLRALAAAENVEVRFYDPVDLLRPWKLNYRLHDKYLIADGERYILGGRNTSDLFLGSYQEKRNIDRDVLVVSNGSENSSVRQLAAYFESVWSQPENRTIKGRASEKTGALHERYESLRENCPAAFADAVRLVLAGHDAPEGAVIGSVVPRLTEETARSIRSVTGLEALVVGPTTPAGLEIAIEEPETLGVDLLAADAAAAAEYPLPVVVFDFGTATTVTVVDRQRRYRGGVILAGVKLSLHALFSGTAQLPDIALEPPGKVICSVTEDSLQAGAIYGAAAMADGLLERMEEELGQPCTAVATGGLSGIITPYCRRRILHDDSLLLRGLALIWRKNCGNR